MKKKLISILIILAIFIGSGVLIFGQDDGKIKASCNRSSQTSITCENQEVKKAAFCTIYFIKSGSDVENMDTAQLNSVYKIRRGGSRTKRFDKSYIHTFKIDDLKDFIGFECEEW